MFPYLQPPTVLPRLLKLLQFNEFGSSATIFSEHRNDHFDLVVINFGDLYRV